MLIIEKGKSKTAPAETARVNVLKNNLEEKRSLSPAIEKSKEYGRNLKRIKTLKSFNPKSYIRFSLNMCSWETNDIYMILEVQLGIL